MGEITLDVVCWQKLVESAEQDQTAHMCMLILLCILYK